MIKDVLKQSVGIDVSKDSFSVCFAQREVKKEFRILSTRTFLSNGNGFKQFAQWYSRYQVAGVPLHFLMEATGVYYEELAYFLHGQGCLLCVLLPNKTNAYARSLGYKSKTDAIDAKMLAQMSLERDLPLWTPPSGKMLELKRLCREREELLSQKTVTANRIHARDASYQAGKASLRRGKKLVQLIEKQVTEVDNAIRSLIKADPELRQKVDILCSIKGVGITTAANIIAETNGFALFKNKAQLVSYAGYDVVQRTSGTSVKGISRISKRGNKHIRRALYFPALTAVKHEPKMTALYQRVYDRTKIKMKAYVAVQRKLLVLLYTLYKKNQPFDPNFQPPHLQNRQELLPA